VPAELRLPVSILTVIDSIGMLLRWKVGTERIQVNGAYEPGKLKESSPLMTVDVYGCPSIRALE
jgi:hypothetical protein